MSSYDARPIGIIRSPFLNPQGTPIQPVFSGGAVGEVVLDDEFEDGLADIDGFERIWLVYWCHKARPHELLIVPYRDKQKRGVFATRAPSRPNPIGLSVVRLLGREGNRLRIADMDIVDGTPLLDIKPYVPRFDSHPLSAAGWLDRDAADRRRADGRFHDREE